MFEITLHNLDDTLGKDAGIFLRPVWRVMNELPMFSDCLSGDLTNINWLEEPVVNIPSSAIIKC